MQPYTGSKYNPTVALYSLILHTKSEWEFNMDGKYIIISTEEQHYY